MATKILVRRGLKEELQSETLEEGEIGFNTDRPNGEDHDLGLYIGSDEVTAGYIKINSTKNIEYEGNALTSAADTNNLEEAIQNIDVALKTEQDNVDTAESNIVTLQQDLDALELEDLNNISLTDIANGQVLKYSDGNWVNSGDIDENTKYTFGIDGTTWSAPGGAVYDGEAITLEASTGDQDDATIKFIKGSSRMVISNPASDVVVLNSLPRPFTVNENDPLGVDEEITLTQGNNITITEADGVITFDVADITTATQTALNLKANLDSPALEGTPTAPIPTQSAQIANKGYVDTAINNAVFGDAAVEWVLEGEQSGEILPSGFNVFIDDISWDFINYDYKVVFDFETTGEDNDEPYLRFNGLTSSSTNYNYLTKTTSSENDGVTVASLENTSLIKFGAKLPINSINLGQTQYQGEFIIRRSVLGAQTPGTPNHNYSVRGFASVTAASAPTAGFLGFPVESIFVGNFWTGTTGFTSIDIYSGISAGSSDYAKARIYKRAK